MFMTPIVSNSKDRPVDGCAGIIAEYNPFHNGHLHHIRETRRLTGASHIIAVMSGDYVQRGEPAVYDKYARTRMALEAGVDLVLELPVLFAVSSASEFAACAVRILDQLGVVDSLCFGSECGDLEALSPAAAILAKEPPAYRIRFKEALKKGLSFPQARSMALLDGAPDLAALLSSPNNILGAEYLTALLRQKSRIRPFTITRSGGGYHDDGWEGELASASAVRSALGSADCETLDNFLTKQVPPWVRNHIRNGSPLWPDDFSALLNYRLLSCLSPDGRLFARDLSDFLDWPRDLAQRLKRQIFCFQSYTERCKSLKTKQYTYTRISRCMLHALLDLTQEDFAFHKNAGYCNYVRVLGFRRDAAPLLGAVKQKSAVPLLVKTADSARILDDTGMELFKKDLFASHVYEAAASARYGAPVPNEFQRSPVIV